MKKSIFLLAFLTIPSVAGAGDAKKPSAEAVLDGLRAFIKKTAKADGSFQPGIDPEYRGMSDSAASNLAPVTYAVVIHRTFDWKLPNEAKTLTWIIDRQNRDGAFANTAGTVDPKSPQGRVYNTTMALMALKGLDSRPAYDPLPVFAKVMEKDYKQLPAYSSSFFPLAYQLAGAKLPDGADKAMRATMIQADDGYINDHVAATFHAVHYDKLLNATTPKADLILKRTLKDQRPDGSWTLNPLRAIGTLASTPSSSSSTWAAAAKIAKRRSAVPPTGPCHAAMPTAVSAIIPAALPTGTRAISMSARW